MMSLSKENEKTGDGSDSLSRPVFSSQKLILSDCMLKIIPDHQGTTSKFSAAINLLLHLQIMPVVAPIGTIKVSLFYLKKILTSFVKALFNHSINYIASLPEGAAWQCRPGCEHYTLRLLSLLPHAGNNPFSQPAHRYKLLNQILRYNIHI